MRGRNATVTSPTRFTLHAHEQSASGDSDTPIEAMADEYARRGFDLVGFVGHDARPRRPNRPVDVEVITGVEHEVRTRPRRLHIVEFPEYDLRILAHPSLTHPNNTVEQALQDAEAYNVDAIEAYNKGSRELPDQPVMDSYPRVSGDDAHNTHQVGASYMETMVPPEPEAVTQAVKEGRVTLENPGRSLRSRAAGRLHQGLSLVASGELWEVARKR